MHLRSLTIAIAATLLHQASPRAAQKEKLSWVPNPRETNSWVADPAHHLGKFTVQSIDSIIDALNRDKSIEMAVVVIDSLDGLEPADAALLLHRRWGVGKRQRDNGIVFLWSPALRKTYVSVGYGLEGVLPDARAGRILDQWVLPSFRANNFDGGMLQECRSWPTRPARRPRGVPKGSTRGGQRVPSGRPAATARGSSCRSAWCCSWAAPWASADSGVAARVVARPAMDGCVS